MKKNKNISYTAIANQVIRDKNISLAAKGMYDVVCSAPPGWKSSLKGYASVLKEGVTAIRNAVSELERAGYITRIYHRDKSGKFSDVQYRPNLVPFADTPVSDEPSSDNPISDNQIGKYICNETNIKEDKNKEINIEENTVLLTGDLADFEKYFRRSLTPTEGLIWKQWKEEGINSKAILRAIKDNEFRKERLTLQHVDETLRDWKERGLTTLKKIDKFLLDNKLYRTEHFLREKYEFDDEKYESERAQSAVGQLVLAIDYIMDSYKNNGEQFLRDICICSVEVFRYLPDAALEIAIHYFDRTGNGERKQAAVKALDEEVWS